MTYRQFIQDASQQLTAIYPEREAANIARTLVEDLAGISKTTLAQLMDDALPATLQQQLSGAVPRLLRHEPLQYVTGVAYFFNRMFAVNSHVLIPRPETEELVDWILKQEGKDSLTVLDIGTGSGCIPITLKLERPNWQLHALDVSAGALQVAHWNAEALQASVDFQQLDFLHEENWPAIPQVQVVVSNPPYITHAEMAELEPHVKDFEPAMALAADGPDGLIFYQKICTYAMHYQAPGARLYLELNARYADEIAQIAAAAGLQQVTLQTDMQGLPRMLFAVVP